MTVHCLLYGHDWHGQSYAGCVTCQRCGKQVLRHIADMQHGDGWVWIAAVISFAAAVAVLAVVVLLGGMK